ncbi:MAG: hypothetical protein OIN83_00245 [Candidatus Methanoperedens sp.]|nr:hypothetical protein [Candidatus Methanoperedens sp.]
MDIHKDKENVTLVLSKDELLEIKEALGVRSLYLEALYRKKRSKDIEARLNDKPRNMYIQISKVIE